MKTKAKILKGFRDFLPEIAIQRDWLEKKLKINFERYGFDPLETPALEYGETLLNKYGNEGNKLLYLFKDQGKRLVGLRYDQTVPLARVIAMYPNLIKPFKRYQIQPVWRAEKPQKGRFREFLQCDIDIIGEKSVLAELEIIDCVFSSFKSLGLKKIKILLNDRKNFIGIDNKFINTIDKLPKINQSGVIDELTKKGLNLKEAKELLNTVIAKKPTNNLKLLFNWLKKQGYREGIDFVYQPTLARGLDYYTGIIYEVISTDYPTGSLGGGGRYDNLISSFFNQQVPAVGFAFGFDRIIELVNNLKLIPNKKTTTQVLVTVFNKDLVDQSIKIAAQLREAGINTELFLNEEAKLEKQLSYASKKMIPYVIIIGPEELKNNQIKIKNMFKKEEKSSSLNNLIKELKNN